MCIAMLAIGCGPTLVWYGHSQDRRHRVQVIERGGRQYIERDGARGQSFDGIGVPTITFSPDNRRLAYAARQDETWYVIVDGVQGAGWDGIGPVLFSPSSEGAHT